MSITLSILLYLYLALVLIWLIGCLVAIFHVLKFGFKNLITYVATFIFMAGTILILLATLNFILAVDWNKDVTIFQNPFNNNVE
jgi:hypothetical protein